jgi:hypothetical protein
MTPELTPHNETANNSDDSAADGIEGDHAWRNHLRERDSKDRVRHAATVPG